MAFQRHMADHEQTPRSYEDGKLVDLCSPPYPAVSPLGCDLIRLIVQGSRADRRMSLGQLLSVI